MGEHSKRWGCSESSKDYLTKGKAVKPYHDLSHLQQRPFHHLERLLAGLTAPLSSFALAVVGYRWPCSRTIHGKVRLGLEVGVAVSYGLPVQTVRPKICAGAAGKGQSDRTTAVRNAAEEKRSQASGFSYTICTLLLLKCLAMFCILTKIRICSTGSHIYK